MNVRMHENGMETETECENGKMRVGENFERMIPGGLTDQHISRRTLSPEGQVEGMGRWSLLLPTPQIMADAQTF